MLRHHPGERAGLEPDQYAHQQSKGERVWEDPPQDRSLLAMDAGRRRLHDYALGIDHLAHHAAGAVGRTREQRIEPKLLGRHPLQAPKQRVA